MYEEYYVYNKVKVNLTLEQATKAQRAVEVYSSTLSVTSALGGMGGQRTGKSGTPCIGGWAGHKACLDCCRKSRPHRDSIHGPSSP